MNSATIRTAIASMVLGIVSVSFCVPAILFSFFRWLPGMLIVLVSLACGILAIVMGARARVLRPAGRAIAGLCWASSVPVFRDFCFSVFYFCA